MKLRIFPVTQNSRIILFVFGFLAALCLFICDDPARCVLAPIIAALFITLLFWLKLNERRKEIPLADLGVITVLAMSYYTVIPPLQFLLSGMQYTDLSARQLYVLAPTPEELGGFTWWYVIYLLAFAVGYLVFDLTNRRERINPRPPNNGTVWSFVILFVLFSAFLIVIDLLFGVKQSAVYGSEKMYAAYEALLQMPLLFRQFYGIIVSNGMFIIVKLGLLLTIFVKWKKPVYRYAFYTWLLLLFAGNILKMGNRTELVLISLASVIMYHRFVKPLRIIQITSVGMILFAVFMLIGMMRGSVTFMVNLEKLKHTLDSPNPISSRDNEFQTLFGGNYDLLYMKQSGLIEDVPLQFKVFDLVMVLPQQVLPFEKLDVQQWYINRSENPGYFMFNPIAQAIIGFGWVELILRGLFLGFLFVNLRAWCIRRASSFWATLFYFYLIIISYYMIRATAIYVLLVSVLFRFFPLFFLVLVMRKIRLSVRGSSGKKFGPIGKES
jgi:hypothetical protein